MKTAKFDPNRFTASVVYSIFTQWLRRNGYYSKFMANVSSHNPLYPTPQAALRSCFAIILDSKSRFVGDIVVSSFLFDSTPEGSEYWDRVSDEWYSFVDNFSVHF